VISPTSFRPFWKETSSRGETADRMGEPGPRTKADTRKTTAALLTEQARLTIISTVQTIPEQVPSVN
jgi:hypothetical protein